MKNTQLFNQVEPEANAKRPKIKLPKGYEDEANFLDEMRTLFREDMQADTLNRDAALEDLRFLVGDQWDDPTRQRREAAQKPVLTINRLPAFVAQVLGSRRLNETEIKVVPDTGGTQEIAKLREDLIRNIQKVSRSKFAYDTALAGSVICGIGNFQVEMEYESDDVFEQKITIAPIPDHLAVVWDRMLTDSSGKDASRCFVVDTMSKNDFYKKWPWATPADLMFTGTLYGQLRSSGWISQDDVRIVNYWRMRTVPRTLALMTDGQTRDITDDMDPDTIAQIAQKKDGTPMVRTVNRRYAQMYVCSAMDVLEGPYELPINRIPVFRVPGWEMKVGEWSHRWGLLRFLKDPQRLHNYWRSVIAEKLMQTPRNVWVAPAAAVAGREADWRQSHLSDDPLLIYNDEAATPPQRQQPAILEQALIEQAVITSQDIKDVSNIHEANLGMPSNEVSGAAIVARQRVSDTGTILYHDNLAAAIEEAGRVINELIPYVYDTPRIIKVIGPDDKEEIKAINGFLDSGQAPVIDTGKYAVSITTGPSYATKRIEAQVSMHALANSMPQVFSVAPDLLVQAMDWPNADILAARLKNTVPPNLLAPKEQTPQTMQALQQQSQEAAQQKDLAIKSAVADWLKTQSETLMNQARAANYQSEVTNRAGQLQNDSLRAASEAAASELKGHLDAIELATSAKHAAPPKVGP